MPASDLLDGRVAVVTGSTRGIGLAIAQAFAEAGARVMVNGSSSEEAARDVASTLPGGPGAHAGCQADVRSSADVTAMAARVREHFGRCDILVNNAGFTKFIPHENLDELSDGIFDRVVLTNLKGPFVGARTFAPMLREHGDGLIVNISSIAATSAIGSNVAYCASKAGLVNLTKSLARALAPDIRVNAVSPGLADTELTKGFGEYRQRQVDLTPMGRLASTADIAACVLALATTLTFVTGEEISVDGGRLLT
jgi:3-oxoacyl-[acyl-carrier protein] reductase